MARRSILRPKFLASMLIPAAVLGMLAFAVPSAQAATPLGSLTLSPATGLAASPITMTTVSSGAAKGCPDPTTNISGYVTGPGGWADGILSVGNTSAGVSTTSDFTVELADSFAGLALSNSVTIVPGKYTITVYCQNRFGTTRYGEFSAPLWFTDATHYQSTDPAGPVLVTTSTSLLTSPASTAVAGSPVSLTATVTPAAAPGTVQFTDTTAAGSVNIGSPVTVAGGSATASTTTLSAGSHTLAAIFTPTSTTSYTSSTSAGRTFTVTPPVTAPVVTATSISATPVSGAKAGDPVTLLASLTPTAAAGSVQFTDTIAGTTVNVGAPVTVTGGSARLVTTSLSAAAHSLKSVFTPADAATYAPSSSSSLAYVVSPAVTPVTQTSTALTVSPADSAVPGDPVTLRAAVSPGAASGSVQFRDTVGGSVTDLGQPVPVVTGATGLSTLTISSLTAGPHSFTAAFIPTSAADFAPSVSGPVAYSITTPAAVKTSLTLTASPAVSSQLGDPVTFTATVSPAGATGTVTFVDPLSSTPLGTGDVREGVATLITRNLAAGQREITAAFAPADPTRYQPSTSTGLSYTVTQGSTPPAASTTSLQVSPDGSAAAGADVTLTATVGPAGAAGAVQFFDVVAGTRTPIGTPAPVSAGQAVLTTRFAATGAHALSGAFTPTDPAVLAPSTSADVAYLITPADTPQAKPTSTWLSAWPTRWCPRGGVQALGQGGDWTPSHPRRCQGAVLIARVRPHTAPGQIVFTDTTGNGTVKPLGSPVTVQDGWALVFITVTPGRHTYAATFVPQSADAYQPSTSNEIRVCWPRDGYGR